MLLVVSFTQRDLVHLTSVTAANLSFVLSHNRRVVPRNC